MSTESDQTEEQAIDFAQRLENMLTEVLGQPSDGQYTADPQGARKKTQRQLSDQDAGSARHFSHRGRQHHTPPLVPLPMLLPRLEFIPPSG